MTLAPKWYQYKMDSQDLEKKLLGFDIRIQEAQGDEEKLRVSMATGVDVQHYPNSKLLSQTYHSALLVLYCVYLGLP